MILLRRIYGYLCTFILLVNHFGNGCTLYLNDSRPSRSMLFAQLRAIHVAHHIIPGIAAIHNASVRPCRMKPSRKTTPDRTPFKVGINRRGPSSGLVGRTPCFRGRKYAL